MSARWIMPTLFAIFTFTPLDRINGRLFQHGLGKFELLLPDAEYKGPI